MFWVKGMESPTVKIMSPSEAQLGASKVSIRMVTDSTVLMDWESHSSAMQKSTIRMIMHPNSNVTTIQWQFVQEYIGIPGKN
jgi:hypothetical protein